MANNGYQPPTSINNAMADSKIAKDVVHDSEMIDQATGGDSSPQVPVSSLSTSFRAQLRDGGCRTMSVVDCRVNSATEQFDCFDSDALDLLFENPLQTLTNYAAQVDVSEEVRSDVDSRP